MKKPARSASEIPLSGWTIGRKGFDRQWRAPRRDRIGNGAKQRNVNRSDSQPAVRMPRTLA